MFVLACFCIFFEKLNISNNYNSEILILLIFTSLFQALNERNSIHAQLLGMLFSTNFDLQDKFCDSVDLQDSWDNMNIPDELLTFLCVLLEYNRNDLEYSMGSNNNSPLSDRN